MFTLKTGVFKSALCLLKRQTNCSYRKEIWPKHVVGNKKGSYRVCGPGSSVGIATGYRLDGPGIESRWRRDFTHLSRPALRPTQPPVQWALGLSRR
jgi:hypothetical protein